MKEITEPFERLLWFIYRVLFTLLPSVFLGFIIIWLLTKCNFITNENIRTIKHLGFSKWIIFLAFIFCLNLILESLTNLLVFRLLNFRKLSQDQYGKDSALIILLTTYNPKILELLKANHPSKEDESGNITLEAALFNFGLTQGNQKSLWFNNYVWFLISREFLFSNVAIVILILFLVLLPFNINRFYFNDAWAFVWLQIFELIAVVLTFIFTKNLLKINYPPNKLDYEKHYSESSKKSSLMLIVPISLFIISLFLLPFENAIPFSIFLFANSMLFLVAPLLFLRAMREFIHVEYLILTHFAKDNYEDQLGIKKTVS